MDESQLLASSLIPASKQLFSKLGEFLHTSSSLAKYWPSSCTIKQTKTYPEQARGLRHHETLTGPIYQTYQTWFLTWFTEAALAANSSKKYPHKPVREIYRVYSVNRTICPQSEFTDNTPAHNLTKGQFTLFFAFDSSFDPFCWFNFSNLSSLCWFHSPVCFSVNIQSLLLVNKITYQAFSFSIKPTGQHHSHITSWCPALKKM